ncbi:uncharacterized protein [Mytilus edulis]|uniref:uncharacterized protein n=1 Tax=Mytilus edulis TaxID=6550 RepID=UPI0039EE3390
MAFSKSVIRSQAPAKCGICETDRPIKWKCVDCIKLLCNNCKEKVHPKFENAKNHQVVNIKDVGQPSVVEININKQYQNKLYVVDTISYCHDDSLWIKSNRDRVLQRVKPDGTKLEILSSFNIKIYGMDVTQSNSLLLITGEARLKQISSNMGSLTDSVYDLSPLEPTAVHITSDNKVLVGGVNKDYPKPGRRVVILMNQNGVHERVYEHDQHKQPVFTFPRRITCTKNSNIHVVDEVSGYRHRVVVLGQGSDIINIYTGDREINKNIPFRPLCIVATPRDNVLVADTFTSTFHILNNVGLLMTYYRTSDINIIHPYSLVFSPTGQLYIGCAISDNNKTDEDKIYEVAITGC